MEKQTMTKIGNYYIQQYKENNTLYCDVYDEKMNLTQRAIRCMEVATGRTGWYDTIGKKFYPDRDVLPNKYVRFSEYTQCDFIDTGKDK